MAEEEITDKSKVQEELLDLQMRFEMDEVSEEEYKKKETKLLERLEAIRKYEEERNANDRVQKGVMKKWRNERKL